MSPTVIIPILRNNLLISTCLLAGQLIYADELGTAQKATPLNIIPASEEGQKMMKGIKIPTGYAIEQFAAEPDLANPVSFTFDEKGRSYVVETFRLHQGVTDIRGHMEWLSEDLACRTPDDRLAMMKHHEGSKIADYAKWTDRVRLLEDRDGDGKVDFSSVFADGFNHPLDGIAAGVLARRGQVWFANLPNLWWLKDTNGDGQADQTRSLSYGYGVRMGFLGHDMHGLTFGPEGKIYFSIGDRGANVAQNGKNIGHPDCGSVFRCNPDGSDLEEVAFGLRNPQGLTFDQYGNLFTGDNNSDGGDKARWVYLVEGGDSGWRVGWQFIEYPNARGPWNSEKMWHPQWPGQPAHLLPAITNLANGPSGVSYNPGTGLSDKYNEHFFLTDFRGSRSSGIYSFTLKPNGATFTVEAPEQFIWNCLPTDVGFGSESGIYFSDWVEGWGLNGKGRIYRVFDPNLSNARAAADTKRIRTEGMEKRSLNELGKLLAHADQRVRQEAQFELANRKDKALKTFTLATTKNTPQLGRIHAIWGLGQLAAAHVAGALNSVLPLLTDSDPEIRAQSVRILGDHRTTSALSPLISALSDENARVRFFAAQSLGKLGQPEAIQPLLGLLRANSDHDTYLRHAAVMGLLGTAQLSDLLHAANDMSPSVRLGVLLTLRRLGRAEVALFLSDTDPRLVLEAARAINDEPISGAIPELAAMASQATKDHPSELLRRIVNANFRYGRVDTVQALAHLASNTDLPEAIRSEAIMDIRDWATPSGIDRVSGLWRPTAVARKSSDAIAAIKPILNALLTNAPDSVRLTSIGAITPLRLTEAGSTLAHIIKTGTGSGDTRAAALRALGALNDPLLSETLTIAQNDTSEAVRKEVIKLKTSSNTDGAVSQLLSTLEKGSFGEKQSAFTALGDLPGTEADEVLGKWLEKLKNGQVDKEVELDLLEAAAKRKSDFVKSRLAAFEALPSATGTPKGYRSLLFGGNATAGKQVFFERAEASCNRCHKVNGEGGEVGPELAGVLKRLDRVGILDSIIKPNEKIAVGFETVMIATKAGQAYAGLIKSENDKELVLNSPEDGLITIPIADIKARDRGASAMPEGFGSILTQQDLRNLVEYLSTTK